jgi:hypothetical protein
MKRLFVILISILFGASFALADTKQITDLPAMTAPATGDELAIYDTSASGTKKVDLEYIQSAVDVRWYSATTSAADNSTEINNAINSGYSVYIPPGTWKITSPIDMKDGVIVRGAGMDQTIIQNDGTGVAIRYAAANTVNRSVLSDMQIVDSGSGTDLINMNTATLNKTFSEICKLKMQQRTVFILTMQTGQSIIPGLSNRISPAAISESGLWIYVPVSISPRQPLKATRLDKSISMAVDGTTLSKKATLSGPLATESK